MLSAGELHVLVEEARPQVLGGRIQKIRWDAGRLGMQVYPGGTRCELLWVLHLPYPRVQLTAIPPASGEDAPPLFAQIRALLTNARVLDLRALPGERIVILEAEAIEDSVHGRYKLVAELFGARCNLHLTGSDERILHSLRPPHPRAAAGIYAPPVRDAVGTRSPGPLFQMLPEGAEAPFGPAFEAWAAQAEQEHRSASEKSGLIKAIGKRLRKEEQLLQALDMDLAAAGRAPELRRRGELILQNLNSIPKGASSVVLVDYACEPPEEVQVPLDPARPPSEIARESFVRAKKLTRSLTKLGARHAEATARISELRNALASAEQAETGDAIGDLRRMAQARRWMAAAPPQASGTGPAPGPKPRQVATRKPYRTFRSEAGVEILVGRTAADNDELTLKIARGNDLWLHAANYAGSHVVVRTAGEVPGETLLDAALLAIHYSQARKAGGGEVSYTRAKHVRKFRGARPGQVQLAERKSLRVRPDPARLQRILDTGGEGGPA